MGINPNNLVAFVGPHSPLAQSGKGTITVCNSSQQIYRDRGMKIIMQIQSSSIIVIKLP